MALTYTQINAVIADSPGASVDKEFFDELKSNLGLLEAGSDTSQKGTSTFAGVTGQAITITAEADTAYHVSIMPTASPGGNLGEVWVINDSTTQFTVYNSGSATTAFRWQVT